MTDVIVKECFIKDAEQIRTLFPLFSVLRPHLTENDFVHRVLTQAAEGYRIAYVEKEGIPVAAAGFRLASFLAWGKILYIDDLIADPKEKKQGFGGALLDWLINQAESLRCDAVHLDTGYTRHDAHRLYLNKRFVLSCHHMARKLDV